MHKTINSSDFRNMILVGAKQLEINRLTGTITRNKSTVLLQVVRNFYRVERDQNVEV